MADSRFYSKNGSFSLRELSKKADFSYSASVGGDELIYGASSILDAHENEIAIFYLKKYARDLLNIKARFCITSNELAPLLPNSVVALISENPYKSFVEVLKIFYPDFCNPNALRNPGISDASHVDKSAKIGQGSAVECGAIVKKNVVIGENGYIGSNSVIEDGVEIGANTIIYSNVTISHVLIGANVTIHTGARIGQEGFGFVNDGGFYKDKVPQLGRIIIEDGVEIGANTTIDRGSLGDTKIGERVRIDNLVQIGHNVEIGSDCVIVAQVGIAGSTKIGKNVLIGAQSGITGQIHIGNGVRIAAQSGVTKSIEENEIIAGFPAMPIKLWRKSVAILRRMAKGKKND